MNAIICLYPSGGVINKGKVGVLNFGVLVTFVPVNTSITVTTGEHSVSGTVERIHNALMMDKLITFIQLKADSPYIPRFGRIFHPRWMDIRGGHMHQP
jgi:hypothetical protein